MATITRPALRAGVLVLAVLATVVLTARLASAATWAGAEEALVERMNAERRARALPPLAVNVQLTRVARDWTPQMAGRGELRHNPQLAAQVSGGWTRLGENIGWTQKTGAGEAELVDRLHAAFMQSRAHRDNILGDWNQVGVGVVIAGDGKMWATVDFMHAGIVPANTLITEAVAVSRSVFPAGRRADHVVLARADVFADALGGAALAGGAAPMLFTTGPTRGEPDPVVHPGARAEIDRVTGGRGTVYLLGGPSAVSSRAAAELSADGYVVRRLAGPSRVETAVRVAEEVLARRGRTGEVLLARADDWADAVTGGAYAAHAGSPVLLTGRDDLHPAVAAFLARQAPSRRWALGGRAALGDVVVTAAAARRVAGADRAGTAVAVAEQLWGRTEARDGQHFVVVPGWRPDGWAYALAFGPWSATLQAPQLLVSDVVPPAVEGYLRGLGYGEDRRAEVRAATPVPGGVLERIRRLLGG